MCNFPSFRHLVQGILPVLIGASTLISARAQTFDVRAKTHDKIRTNTYVPYYGYFYRINGYQGSFGAPSLNDKGAVAYACILAGSGVSPLANNSVAIRLKGKRPSVIAYQAGSTVSEGFGSAPKKSFVSRGSVRYYRIGRDVAINNNNRIAFAGQTLYTIFTRNDKGEATNFQNVDTAAYAVLVPILQKATGFQAYPVSTYLNYFDGILHETLSLNSQDSIAFNGDFHITDTKTVPGFAFSSPTSGNLIATTESNVIGLPYFAQFQSFSDAIIASGNRAFVTAQITDGNDAFDGIWQGDNPDLQPVAVKTNDAPGGGTFTSFGEKAGPSRNGKFCAFLATTSTGTNGVFRTNLDGSNKIIVAAAGVAAPSNSASGNLGNFGSFSLAASNDAGQVAVLGNVNGRDGIWVSDSQGNDLKLLVIEGQMLAVGSAQKTITKIAFNPVSGINRLGQVAFTASFSDRTSAVIIAHL